MSSVLANFAHDPGSSGPAPAGGAVLDPGRGDLGVEDLEALMSAVNETTERLQRTHVVLQGEVARLQRELVEANAQLRRSRSLAALGEMASGIAHEIRNPLGSIKLNAHLLAEDLAGQSDQTRLCAKIQQAVTGLDAIVHDVLLFAREMRIRPATTTAADLVEQTAAACEGLLAAGAVRFERMPSDEFSLPVKLDACLMVQALSNVVRNAAEAIVEADAGGGRIVISAAREAVRGVGGELVPCLVIAVEDDGPGIPADVVERMFNPFFTTREAGTGLGLAIVHRIVDAHGGRMRVGRAAGGGARVELCLPVRPGGTNPGSNGVEAAVAPVVGVVLRRSEGTPVRRVTKHNNQAGAEQP